MPNVHGLDQMQLNIWLSRDLAEKVSKKAAQLGRTKFQVVRDALAAATDDVELSADDYRKIAADIEAAARKRGGR